MKPLEISLFERPGTGGRSSRLSEEDDEEDGAGGLDSISGRFRQRLVELTGEATLAAEEEEGFLRHVAANMATITATAESIVASSKASKGGGTGAKRNAAVGAGRPQAGDGAERGAYEALALAAAREWRFVSTDSRLRRPSHGTGSSNAAAKPPRCWYRSETREYYWGDTPPLVGLFLRLGDDWPWKKKENNPASTGAGGVGHGGGGGSKSAPESGGAIDGDDNGETTPTGVVHPELGLVFADRASGEAWLKTQDPGALLARSEKLCDIGPAGWRQLRTGGGGGVTAAAAAAAESRATAAAPPGSSSAATTVSTMTEHGVSSAAGAAAGSGGGAFRGRDDNVIHGGQKTAASAGVGAATSGVGQAAAPTVLAVSEARKDSGPAADVPSPADLPPSFAFFHHAGTGEVRWCLSPRSALLATPLTPRRAASQARNEAAAAAEAAAAGHQGEQSWGEDGAGEVNGGGGDEALALVDDAASGDWEMVEDGDMVFYFNKRLGVSTWEPPPGWEQGGSQEESFGAGG